MVLILQSHKVRDLAKSLYHRCGSCIRLSQFTWCIIMAAESV